MKENEKRFAQGAMFRVTPQKRQAEFAGTPGWYFDWDTGQYWLKGTSQEEKDEFRVSLNGQENDETANSVEGYINTQREKDLLKMYNVLRE